VTGFAPVVAGIKNSRNVKRHFTNIMGTNSARFIDVPALFFETPLLLTSKGGEQWPAYDADSQVAIYIHI
jgi:hypothetical protein